MSDFTRSSHTCVYTCIVPWSTPGEVWQWLDWSCRPTCWTAASHTAPRSRCSSSGDTAWSLGITHVNITCTQRNKEKCIHHNAREKVLCKLLTLEIVFRTPEREDKVLYLIAENSCGVQIFMNRLVSGKIKAMGVVTSCKKVSLALELRLSEGTKTTKISSTGDFTKICTCKNIPLYNNPRGWVNQRLGESNSNIQCSISLPIWSSAW